VLFADLKGSMELLADRDPEEAGEILDRWRHPQHLPSRPIRTANGMLRA
jgi:hypothetical protein